MGRTFSMRRLRIAKKALIDLNAGAKKGGRRTALSRRPAASATQRTMEPGSLAWPSVNLLL